MSMKASILQGLRHNCEFRAPPFCRDTFVQTCCCVDGFGLR